MNAHETLVMALANAAPPEQADTIVGSTLELAIAECDILYRLLEGHKDGSVGLLVAALEGRLTALDSFIAAHVDVTWKSGHVPTTEGGAP